ncbi:uncharacterized protein TNCV_4070301 [Trichonephila clavipes]|nr:uncharacterized protein TNCV_4070301 [Trichonephila clavipes]
MEEIGGLGIPLRSLWNTLHCRRVAGVSPLLSIDWWYLSSVSPKRHCFTVSAADKGWRVYPLDPHPDVVLLYSGCTIGAWYLPDDRHTTSFVGLRGGWRHARTKLCFTLMQPMLLCPVSTVSTSSSSTQAHLLPSTSSVIPTVQNQSYLPILVCTTAIFDNSLNTSASSSSTETRLFATTSNKFSPLSTEIQPSVSLAQSSATTSNGEPLMIHLKSQRV